MYKIKTLVPIFLFLLSSYTAFTQVNFVAGTIVKLNGDTLKGEIDYQEWTYNPRTIQFRNKNTQSAKDYTCRDIKGFTITDKNEKYQTVVVDINKESDDIDKLKTYESIDNVPLSSKLTRDTVFLLIEAQGALNLFSLFDGKPHYFIQKNKGKIEELENRRAKIVNRDTVSIIMIENFKIQLKTLTDDCASPIYPFVKPAFVKAEILQVVTKYNTCKGESSYIFKEGHGQRRFSLLTGAALPLIKISDFYNFNAKTAQGNISPVFGMAFEQSYKRLRNRVSMGIEFNFALCKADISTDYTITDRVVYYKVNAVSTKLNPYIQYAFTANKIQPYVKVGLGISYFSKPNVERFYTETFTPIPTILKALDMPKIHFLYLTSFGLKSNNLFIEMRYDANLGAVGKESNSATTKQLALLGGYSWALKSMAPKK
jgi:hypothetical protein